MSVYNFESPIGSFAFGAPHADIFSTANDCVSDSESADSLLYTNYGPGVMSPRVMTPFTTPPGFQETPEHIRENGGTLEIARPSSCRRLFPVSPPKMKRSKKTKSRTVSDDAFTVHQVAMQCIDEHDYLFPMESNIAQEARQNLARRYYSI
jgi:hypothetical protein